MHPQAAQRVRRGATGTAGTQLHHVLQARRILRHLRQAALQPRDKSRIVRVVPVECAVLADHHAIDRSQGTRRIREFVQVLHDGLLARVRDVEGVKAQQRRRIQKRRCGCAVQVQGVQVDGAVQVAHPVRVRFRLMHGRGQGRGDAVTNEAHQERFSTQTHSFTVRVRLVRCTYFLEPVPNARWSWEEDKNNFYAHKSDMSDRNTSKV